MKKIDHAISELKEMDALAAETSPVHDLHPAVKLIVTVVYILVVVSIDKYDFATLAVMVLYPALMFQLSGTSLALCLYKLRIVLPLVCAVGLLNPFLDKTPMLALGSVTVTGGVISMITLMLKGIFCVTASYLLVATTPFDRICAALRRLHIPSFIVTLLLLTYRYISVMMEEVSVMIDAYCLRAPHQKGVQFSAWGSFLGQLLLRSMDRAEELYSSMKLRGFNGDFVYAECGKLKPADFVFLLISCAAFFALRYLNIAEALGNMVM